MKIPTYSPCTSNCASVFLPSSDGILLTVDTPVFRCLIVSVFVAIVVAYTKWDLRKAAMPMWICLCRVDQKSSRKRENRTIALGHVQTDHNWPNMEMKFRSSWSGLKFCCRNNSETETDLKRLPARSKKTTFRKSSPGLPAQIQLQEALRLHGQLNHSAYLQCHVGGYFEENDHVVMLASKAYKYVSDREMKSRWTIWWKIPSFLIRLTDHDCISNAELRIIDNDHEHGRLERRRSWTCGQNSTCG